MNGDLALDLKVLLEIHQEGTYTLRAGNRVMTPEFNCESLPLKLRLELLWGLHRRGLISKRRRKLGFGYTNKTYTTYHISGTGQALIKDLGIE